MTALPEAIAQYLESRGLGSYRDSDATFSNSEVAIVLEAMPTAPTQAIVVAQYSGLAADSKLPWDEPRLQVRVRGTLDPSISRNSAQSIYDLLHGLGPVDIFGCHIQLIVGLGSGPNYMGLDQTSRRHEHSVNFEATVFNPNRRT